MKLLLHWTHQFNGPIAAVKVAGRNPFGNNIDFPFAATQKRSHKLQLHVQQNFILQLGIIRFVAYVCIFHKNSQILQFVFEEHNVPIFPCGYK